MLCFIWFAFYSHFFLYDRTYEWMGITSMMLSIFIGCLGLYPITNVISVEIMPQKIKVYGMAALITWMMFCSFIVNTAFPFVKNYYGIPTIYTMFSIVTLMNMLYAVYVLPETRGKSNAEILKMLE